MITVEVLLAQLPNLPRQDLERWISYDWVRPDGQAGIYAFGDIDVTAPPAAWTSMNGPCRSFCCCLINSTTCVDR